MPCASCSKGKTVNAAGLEETVRASCSESGTVAEGERVAMPSASCSKGKTVNEAGLELTVRVHVLRAGQLLTVTERRCEVFHALGARQSRRLGWS